MYQKQTPHRDAEYRTWIRTQPCALCGSGPSQAAHQSILDQAVGRKADDRFILPLCWLCHLAGEHQHGVLTTWNQRSGHTFKDKYILKDHIRELCKRYFERYQKEAS